MHKYQVFNNWTPFRWYTTTLGFGMSDGMWMCVWWRLCVRARWLHNSGWYLCLLLLVLVHLCVMLLVRCCAHRATCEVRIVVHRTYMAGPYTRSRGTVRGGWGSEVRFVVLGVHWLYQMRWHVILNIRAVLWNKLIVWTYGLTFCIVDCVTIPF